MSDPHLARGRRPLAAGAVVVLGALGLVAGLTGIVAHAASDADHREGGTPVPHVGAPIPATATSHPFGATNVDLATYGYEEQEFLVSGRANVYDYDASGKVVVKANGPYVNRITIRRPVSSRHFSGTAIVEIDNMTNHWDLERMWYTLHDQLMRDGDVYVGVSSSPFDIAALQKFDAARYASLSWANPVPAAQRCASPDLNSTADGTTEGGLAWDIFSQVGALLKSDSSPLRGLEVEKAYLTGYSQSAGYMIRYINAIGPRATLDDGRPVWDGYLVGANVLSIRLNSCSAAIPQADPRNVIQPGHSPVIDVQTQTDFYNLGGHEAQRADSDAAKDQYRLYELLGASHSYDYSTGFVPAPADLAKIGVTYGYYSCQVPGLSNDFPQQYVFDGALVNLDAWARHGTAPPSAGRIQVQNAGQPNWSTVVDAHGNAVGGLRTPWVDVPTQTYYPNSLYPGATGIGCLLFGHRVPFDATTLAKLYPNHGTYAIPFITEAQQMVREHWFTLADGEAIINAAANSSIPS